MRYLLTVIVSVAIVGCLPEGDGKRGHDAGADVSDVNGDECGGCVEGECVVHERHGNVCLKPCEINGCPVGLMCYQETPVDGGITFCSDIDYL
jgi:hypothetical protein